MTNPPDDTEYAHEPSAGGAPERPQLRPPIGIPTRRGARWPAPVAVLLHVLLVLALVAPALFAARVLPLRADGAGGPGPAGGGGGSGGNGGLGGGEVLTERLRYLQAPQPAPAPQPVAAPTPVPPRLEPPKPEPPEPEPKVTPAVPEPTAPAPAPATDAALGGAGEGTASAGSGGGTGGGTGGSGPGSGGGVGSGVGTGRGSGTGPGTGGGTGSIYPPTPEFTPLPPFPVPRDVRGDSVVLVFTVSDRGTIEKLEFRETRNRGYNRRIREEFSEARFRPATRMDGTPVSAITAITLRF